MVKTGRDILFQEPTCDTRRLRRSVVVEADESCFSIRFVADLFEFTADQEVLMYFNGKREFMQQVGRINEIAHEDEQCHGMASVQSVRELGPGRIRHGMRAIDEDPHMCEFLQVLQRISLAVRREQLQRSGGVGDE